LERPFRRTMTKVKSELQQGFVKISSQVKGVMAVTSLENETTESRKALYFFSLMLLISLVFLAPDKIPQALTPSQTLTGIFERAQGIIKKLTPNLG